MLYAICYMLRKEQVYNNIIKYKLKNDLYKVNNKSKLGKINIPKFIRSAINYKL